MDTKIPSIPCDRQCRLEVQKWTMDEKKQGVLKFANQLARRDGDIRFDESYMIAKFNDGKGGCYPDDVISVCRDILSSFGNKDKETVKMIELLNEVLVIADQRAMRRHGYSGSKEEADYIPPYL